MYSSGTYCENVFYQFSKNCGFEKYNAELLSISSATTDPILQLHGELYSSISTKIGLLLHLFGKQVLVVLQ